MAPIDAAIRSPSALQPPATTRPADPPAPTPQSRGPRTSLPAEALQQRPHAGSEGTEPSRPPRADAARLAAARPGSARAETAQAPAAAAEPPAGRVRSRLQQAVDALGGEASAPSAALQLEAHHAALAYGNRAGALADRLVPGYHRVMATLNHTVSGGDKPADFATDPAQWLGQNLAAPVLNMIERQQVALPPEAVVPDEMVELMNRLDPGAGHALREQVELQQQQLSRHAPAVGQTIGEVAGSLSTAAQAVRSDSTGAVADPAKKAAVDQLILASTSAAVGAKGAFDHARATVQVPDLAALRKAQVPEGGDGKAVLAGLPTHAAPLSYARHKPISERVSEFKASVQEASLAQYTSAALRVGIKAMDALHPEALAPLLLAAVPAVASTGAGAPVAAAMTGAAAVLGAYAAARPFLDASAKMATAVA